MIDQAVGLPDLPTAPPAELTAPVGTPPPAAATRVLAIEVTATDDVGTSNQAVAPGTVRPLRVTVVNRGAATVAGVSLAVQFDKARVNPGGAWRIEGAVARVDVGSLAAGRHASVPLAVRSADLPPGGDVTARVFVDARAAGQLVASGQFAWMVRDCPGAYRAALQAVRAGALAELREAVKAMRRGDPALPLGLRFRPPVPARGAAGEPARLAAAIASRRGGDPELTRNPLNYTADRTILELDQYMSQRAIPTLCTGAGTVAAVYGKAFAPVEQRLAAIRRAAAAARTAEVASVGGTSGEGDLAERVRRAVVNAQLVPPEAESLAGPPLAVLAQARAAALKPGTRLDPAVAGALSAMEIEAWLTTAEAGANRLSGAFTATVEGIRAAHAASCTCAP